MRKEFICRETPQEVTVTYDLSRDSAMEVEVVSRVNCPIQGTCELFDPINLCPPINRLQKQYRRQSGLHS